MKRCAAILVATTALVLAGRAERGNPEIAWGGRTVDAMVAEFMREHDVPGLAVAIVQAPYVSRVGGYGVGDVGRRTLVASNTLFDIAQMRDGFTAVAIMQLVEGGKLDLDAALEGGGTVRALLRQPTAYGRLEALVERASGGSYEDFVIRGQFERLGLRQTFFGRDLAKAPREALGPDGRHAAFLRDATLINPTEPATGYRGKEEVAPAERGIYASALDISLWDVGLAGDVLIRDPALRKLLYRPEKGGTTTGPWIFPGREGLMVATGSGDGFSSLLSRFTKADELVCVTLLANKEGLDLTQLARRIAGAYDARLGPPVTAKSMRIQQSPYSVSQTIDRLERVLRDRGVGVVARVDHRKAAQSANLELRPTEELIFGNPAQGTLLMQANPAVAVDLPLRAAAWEENGEVWLAATDPVELAERHGLTAQMELALKMRAAVDAALFAAVSPE